MPPRLKKQSRSARGRGSVFFSRSRAVWIGRLPVGKKLAGGTQYREVSASTERECVAKLNALRPPASTVTVGEWCQRWLVQLRLRPSSLAAYRASINQYIGPTLGHLALATLTAYQIEAASRSWNLGNNSVRHKLTHLRICLESARRAGIIAANPARDARQPSHRRAQVELFTPPELARIVAAGGLFALLASTGCRIGEALALDVGDFDGASVRIHRTYTQQHGLRATKSDNSVRTVRIPDAALSAVVEAHGGRNRGPLFLSSRLTRRSHSSVVKPWRKLLRSLGLAYRRIHVLRHSVGTALVAAGIPVADVARYLGDTSGTVVKTYLHPSGADAAKAMGKVLQGGESVVQKTADTHSVLQFTAKTRARV